MVLNQLIENSHTPNNILSCTSITDDRIEIWITYLKPLNLCRQKDINLDIIIIISLLYQQWQVLQSTTIMTMYRQCKITKNKSQTHTHKHNTGTMILSLIYTLWLTFKSLVQNVILHILEEWFWSKFEIFIRSLCALHVYGNSFGKHSSSQAL